MAASSSSSSSSNNGRWSYDVFLSFRGKDTRKNFLDHLYKALENRGIYTYKDDQRLLTGEPISGQLSAAIEQSRLAVVVFSPNYANSAWCLEELAHIKNCRNQFRQTAIPVFYNVDASVVRRQLKSYGEAFDKHEARYEDEKIQKWKDALFEIASLSGFDVSNTANGHESECITKIVQDICSKCRQFSRVERDFVGLNIRVREVMLFLGSELKVVRFVGIWGIGGAGKTTLAWAVYNKISLKFEGKCFVENVKELSRQENGLLKIIQKNLSEIICDKNLTINSTLEGIELMKSRLQRRKVLLVLDDVSHSTQLDALAASSQWFGKGSMIIITTRDQGVLIRPKPSIEMYNASLLNDAEALKLFSLHAFGKKSPPDMYRDDSKYLVRKSGGFPLALKVLGASLYGSFIRNIGAWKSALSRLEVEGEDEASKILKASYDGLSEINQKILLDIACFFKGEEKERVIRILDSFDFHGDFGIECLIQQSLISVSNERIDMHDRIQEMGWEIVGKSSDKPGERSRLWLPHHVHHALTTNTGTDAVEGISLSRAYSLKAFNIDSQSFQNMNKLRLLELKWSLVIFVPKQLGCLSDVNNNYQRNSQSSKQVECLSNLRWLNWKGCSLDSLPEIMRSPELVGLELRDSDIKKLWDEGDVTNGRKSLNKVRFIDLQGSWRLQQTPCFNLIPNLHTLDLEGCRNLLEVHPSIGDHGQLVFVSLKNCTNLESLPSSIQMKSLETLVLSNCMELRRFPDIKGNMKKLSKLLLNGTSIEKLPASVGNLSGLEVLDLTSCRNLTCLPRTICMLKCLKELCVSSCSKLEKLPEELGQIQSLKELWIDDTQIREMPSSMGLKVYS